MILDELYDHIVSSGIVDDYVKRLLHANDGDELFHKAAKFMLIRPDGGAKVEDIQGFPQFRIALGGRSSNMVSIYNDAQRIINFVNANRVSGSIFNIVVLSDVSTAFPMTDDRSYFEINLQIFQNRV